MSSFDDTVDLLPSKFRQGVKQAPSLGTGKVNGSTFEFTVGDTLDISDRGTLIVINKNEMLADIELTITYNTGLTVDLIIDTSYDSNVDHRLAITDIYSITNVDFKVATADKGTDGDEFIFICLHGNHAKYIYLMHFSINDVRRVMYDIEKSRDWSQAHDDYIDQIALSWDLKRIPGESDDDLLQRVITKSTGTDGTIRDGIERVKNYLNLTIDPTVTEVYDQGVWILDESQLLDGGQSELVLSDGDIIHPMQFLMTITGYTGSLTESDIEDFLRSIINVCASPIVRLT